MRIGRRMLLAGAASTLALRAWAEAPLTSPRPISRTPAADAIAQLIDRADLSGIVAVKVVDMVTGEVLEDIAGDQPQPPASVTKAVTALYALETLGPAHRFLTRVLADGPVVDGVLEGNLILAGGGDPNLVTDDLAELASRLKATGLKAVRGDFQVWDGALVNLEEIDPDQLDHLGYNPTISGLNLNFNRVHFEWRQVEDAFQTTVDARSENHRPLVTSSRVRIVDRDTPVFTYATSGGDDQWTVAQRALNDFGSRWLPVRNPARYAGQVFAHFARAEGIALSSPVAAAARPQGTALASVASPPLRELMRSMLRFSTNITAEVAGLAATAKRADAQRGLRTSALGMARWADRRAGGLATQFVDHSGLGDASRISAADMVTLLMAPGVAETLRPIMRQIALIGPDEVAITDDRIAIRAKTGTLNFVSSLAGYLRTQSGRDLAFAIFAADLDARERGKQQGDETPPGARGWNRKARDLKQDILRHLALRLG